ncbi:MAG TPA: hypothetical protein VFH03_08010 [Actinoplanes sp.]|nr:hypothetical protein [Actinoplanes sp.]
MTTIGITAPRILSSEWRKEMSLRSTWWTLAVLAVAIPAAGIMTSLGVALGQLSADPADVGALGGTLAGISAAEIVVAVFGVLAVTGEYATGSVRSSFTAIPARTPVILAKAGVVGAIVLGMSLALIFGTFAADRALLGSAGLQLSWTAPGVLRALVGAAVYLTLIAVLAGAVGWLVRSTAGAIGVLFGLLYVLPVIGLVLPEAPGQMYARVLPANAGAVMREPLSVPGMLPAWVGFLVVTAWVAVFLIGAVAAVRRRDV